jgi:hypothetical protein
MISRVLAELYLGLYIAKIKSELHLLFSVFSYK